MPTPSIPKRPAPPRSKANAEDDAVKPPKPTRKPHSYGQSAGGPVPANAKPRQPQDAEELAGEPMREE